MALLTTDAKVATWLAPKPPVVRPLDADIDALAALLNGGERITMMCGAGCAGAHAEVVALAAALNAPIVHSLRGKEYVEYDNPFDVGMTGFIGFTSGYAAMKNCDTLVLLGTDFPYRQFYPEGAKIVQIDIRPESLGNRCHLALGVVGDVGATAAALLPRLKSGPTANSSMARSPITRRRATTSTSSPRASPAARSSTRNMLPAC